MKRIAILGSTGSIGGNALEVARNFRDKLCVYALSANSNIALLEKQIRLFRPRIVCVTDKKSALALRPKIGRGVRLLAGEEGLLALCRHKGIDQVVLAVSGSSALRPLLTAIDNRKDIALANKEALVMAGPIIMKRAASRKVKIIPIDSEQSAIWQCLKAEDSSKLKRIYLTASGGPFIRLKKEAFGKIGIAQVLKHPRWKMGAKITVDSATLMNKGLEVLEAISLFGAGIDKIKVLVHPEAIIHSMVEFIDGVVLAQLSVTDMRIPIQYAILYPQRMPGSYGSIDFARLGKLHFQEPDDERFPCLGLAWQAGRESGTSPCVLNAANEIGVREFLKGNLDFISLPGVIEKVLARHRNKQSPDLEDILEADKWARQEAYRIIGK